MSKPWGGIGAWAADAEREEREEAAAAAASGGSQSFPSLRESLSAKTKKKKMTLNEFYAETSSGGVGGGRPKGLTPEEMLRLPTGPKERSADEMQYVRLGAGFSNIGRSGGAGGPGRMRDRDEGNDGSWAGGGGGRRQYGGYHEERRGPPSRVSDYDLPSRADEVDNWATAKKALPSFDSGRYGSLGGGSRADEVDNWAVGKKSILPVRSSTFGSGFRDHSVPEPDRWTRGDCEPIRERPRLVLDPPKGDLGGGNEPARANMPSPFGAARPREDVLAEKGLDWKKLDMEIEAKKTSSQSSRPTSTQSSRPTSTHSSRPSSAHSSRSEGPQGLQQQGVVDNVVSKPRPKVNPFGDAKPREVLLEERGQDWRKIDLELEHRRVDRPEMEEEKSLKEEIDQLKEKLQKAAALKEGRESVEGSGGDQLKDTISLKERELETLIQDLDNKFQFGQKPIERPGSGAGRAAGFPERAPSQSGSVDESRSVEFIDRPRSRGTREIWTRPSDDRRAFHGGRERGFLVGDRPRSRDRW